MAPGQPELLLCRRRQNRSRLPELDHLDSGTPTRMTRLM